MSDGEEEGGGHPAIAPTVSTASLILLLTGHYNVRKEPIELLVVCCLLHAHRHLPCMRDTWFVLPLSVVLAAALDAQTSLLIHSQHVLLRVLDVACLCTCVCGSARWYWITR